MREAPNNCRKKRETSGSGSSPLLTDACLEQNVAGEQSAGTAANRAQRQQLELQDESKLWPIFLGASLGFDAMNGAQKS